MRLIVKRGHNLREKSLKSEHEVDNDSVESRSSGRRGDEGSERWNGRREDK